MAASCRSLPSLALCLLPMLFGQQSAQSPSGQEPVIRISVTLVQVDAVVTDSAGRQVTGLKAEDFEILQDGRPQKITNFSYVSRPAEETRPARQTGEAGPIGAFPPALLRPEQVRRTIVLVVDDLGLSFESTARLRGALKKFVDQQMLPGDLVAILRTGGGMGAFQGFTSDKRQLYYAIERARWNPFGRGGVGVFSPIDDPDADPSAAEEEEVSSGAADIERFREEYFSVGTLGALNYIVRGLRELPGRKSVILFSDNMRIFNPDGSSDRVLDSLRNLTDLANRASVVIYSIDPRGLQTLSLTAADRPSLPDPRGIVSALEGRRQFFESQDGLNYLAAETGGLFIHNRNDISQGIAEVLADQRGYYLIGYHPGEATFNRDFHRIKVRVRHAGLHVRSRNGFYGVPDAAPALPPRTRDDQLFAALSSPFGSSGVRLRLTSRFIADAKRNSYVDSLLHIDGRDVTFTEEPDGWHKAVIDVLVMTFGESGVETGRTSRTHTIRVRGAPYEAARANGFVYTVHHPVRKAGAYQLRTAVRDAVSEKVGAASQFIEVPDLSKGRLAISGILLRAGTLATWRQGRDETDPLGNQAVRVFHPTEQMTFAYQIVNARLDPGSKQPRLETRLRLFQEDRKILDKEIAESFPKIRTEQRPIAAGGQLKLGAAVKPGRYLLQITVTDTLAKGKYRSVSQWIDFEVAGPAAQRRS